VPAQAQQARRRKRRSATALEGKSRKEIGQMTHGRGDCEAVDDERDHESPEYEQDRLN